MIGVATRIAEQWALFVRLAPRGPTLTPNPDNDHVPGTEPVRTGAFIN